MNCSIRYIDEFRDPATARALIGRIRQDAGDHPARLMEVCGTHTVAIARSGIRPLLSGAVTMVSGPGCPVCVTPDGYIDAAIALGREKGALLASFGDMLRVPGKTSSLEREKGKGLDLRVVYSPLDAVALAAETRSREVVFLGVGFETTAPAIAGAIRTAAQQRVANFSVLSSVRTIPEAMGVLAADPEVRIEGFLCPAHVSAIIGADAYLPVAEAHRIPCVVAGFEPLDILMGISMLVRQIREGAARVENEYTRVATRGGNRKAQELVADVFVPCDTGWRGIGVIRASGLRISERYAAFDAEGKFGVPVVYTPERTACRCGDVLKGKILPGDCPLFGKACVPDEPYGPCMVSSEGTCAAHYRYGAS
ncbi:MAG: hydrogenase expression/formation protein HypD [Deltaproteobacteria bacterium]|jgi:hydrogenase expression/formation protein HypD|nr:hydrogenase expression/formation protein HypD [Deltaproteobacteria bacterium]